MSKETPTKKIRLLSVGLRLLFPRSVVPNLSGFVDEPGGGRGNGSMRVADRHAVCAHLPQPGDQGPLPWIMALCSNGGIHVFKKRESQRSFLK